MRVAEPLQPLRTPLAAADAWLNRLYGWRGNPLYHTGVIAAALLGMVLVTGLYLLLFYRIGAPYASVARITHDYWLGAWMRSVHRYASDACVVAGVVHAFRMLVQGRSWGPRALAWVTGVLLLGLIFVCGWTGYVMVWDTQALVLAQEGARLFDALPLFSEPIARSFDGSRPLPGAFFFLNLFAHVALPVGAGLLLWLHVSRVARPVLVPPRALAWSVMAALSLAGALLPVAMAPEADLLRLPATAPYDVFYSFFLPFTRLFSAPVALALVTVAAAAAMAVPLVTKPRRAALPPPSVVDEQLCTGCEQCWLDCPYEAITMVPRAAPGAERSALVARVSPALCTSCGICAGSCAPMGVGPAGRTGRDQLAGVRLFAAAHDVAGRVVLIACARGAGGMAHHDELDGAPVFTSQCTGNLHTSTVEYLLRAGATGVLVASCPPRDCWNREGGAWLEQRLYHDREAELQPRVDKRRVRVVWAGERERAVVAAALAVFRRDLAALGDAPGEADPDVARECDANAEPVEAV
jgi:ferredoxin